METNFEQESADRLAILLDVHSALRLVLNMIDTPDAFVSDEDKLKAISTIVETIRHDIVTRW